MSHSRRRSRRTFAKNTSTSADLDGPDGKRMSASLAIAVANAGGLGGCGALLMQPDAIHKWVADVRAGTNGGFQLNLWMPDPPPKRESAVEDAVRRFLGKWGPEVPTGW